MKQYEYHRVHADAVSDGELSKLGKEGWELVAIHHGYGGHAVYYVLKRELQNNE